MHTFFTCIPHFFRMLWASFFGFFASKRRVDVEACDVERGIPPLTALKESGAADDDNRDIEAATSLLVLPTDDFVDVDLKNHQAACDSPGRRPRTNHRISAVDPVKSRIVNSALKQVQDRAINVVKPVVITQGTVTAVACSAQIEYFDAPVVKPSTLRVEYMNPIVALPIAGRHLGRFNTLIVEPFSTQIAIGYTRSRPKHKHRTVQFALPPTEDSYNAPERINRKARAKRDRESLFDLLDQFPAPPACIPPAPLAPTLACGPRIENRDQVDLPYDVCQSPTISEKSTSSSDSDSIFISGSASDDTAQTSDPGTPDTDEFSFSVSGPTNAKADQSDTHSSQLVARVNEAFAYRPSDTLPPPLDVIDLAHKGSVLPTEDSVITAFVSEDAPLHSPTFFASISDSNDIARHYENLAAGFTDAGLDLSDVFEGNDPKEESEESFRGFKAGFSDTLEDSQMDGPDIVADSIRLNQVELSSPDSNQRPDSLVWFADKGLAQSEITVSPRTKALLEKPVAPLRIVKKSKPRSIDDAKDIQRAESVHWEESMDKVLRAFREAETDDYDFRDLFYRSSSFFSQSSLANRGPVVKRDIVEEDQEERLRRLDESFDSIEKSVEEILAALGLPDPVAVNINDPACISLSGGMTIKKFAHGDAKSAPLPLHEVNVPGEDDYDDRYTWAAVTDDYDDSKSESEGEHDQWSDLLELNAYLE